MTHPQHQKLTFGATSNAQSTHRTRAKRLESLHYQKRTNGKSYVHNSKVPRKLGPRDIGRIKYKQGTKYKEAQTNGTFLDEKIHRFARTSSFLSRKAKNPVHKKETVEQTGTPNNWDEPEYYKSEVQKMYSYHNAKRQGWGGSMQCFIEKPLKPKYSCLESLKYTKLPKGKSVREYGEPNNWTPIDFKYENTGGGFLGEKFWFEGSHVEIEDGLSHLIEALPPKQKLKLKQNIQVSAPTGYQTKINFLTMLRDIVMIEVKRIDKEDKVLTRMENEAFINVEHSQQKGSMINETNRILNDYERFEEEYKK